MSSKILYAYKKWQELRNICVESDVELIACLMTVDLFDYDHSDFIEGTSPGGAATFLEFASEADITLYI